MNSRLHITVLALTLALLAASCREVPVIDATQPKGDTLRENMIGANRIIAHSEEQQIDSYATRHGWHMQRLAGGTRVMVTRHGQGGKVDYEDTVTLHYRVENLAGQTIYDSIEETVVAGRLKPVRGIDAALRTLTRGSQARVILPSEQAYGVVGDADRIGSRMVLVYFLEVD